MKRKWRKLKPAKKKTEPVHRLMVGVNLLPRRKAGGGHSVGDVVLTMSVLENKVREAGYAFCGESRHLKVLGARVLGGCMDFDSMNSPCNLKVRAS